MFKCFVYFRSMEFNDFLKKALDRNPETRPTAAQLLEVRNFTLKLVINPHAVYYSHVNVKAVCSNAHATVERLIKAFPVPLDKGNYSNLHSSFRIFLHLHPIRKEELNN